MGERKGGNVELQRIRRLRVGDAAKTTFFIFSCGGCCPFPRTLRAVRLG